MSRINTQSLNMQNAAADVTVLPAYADKTSNMTDEKYGRVKLNIRKTVCLRISRSSRTALPYMTGTVVPE